MPKIVLFYSSHHGVGRSNIAANLAFLLAAEGQRVGLVDADTRSPMIHYLFGLNEKEISHSFNDYLQGKCSIEEATYDISPHVPASLKGRIFLVPALSKVGEPVYQLNNIQDAELLNEGCHRLIKTLNLDTVLVDAQPGISERTLIAITISDILVVILRLNQRDYQDTGVAVDLIRKLDIPRILLIVNEAPRTFELNKVKAEVEKIYNCEVAAVLPYVEEVMVLANKDIFALRYPNHPLTTMLKQVMSKLMTR
jgi:MinD-like ATPase involved in chromosome partitioning or flagellar assembly